MRDKKDLKIEDKNTQKPSQKGRYAEKLNLKMDFNEALKKAVNTKVMLDKKYEKNSK